MYGDRGDESAAAPARGHRVDGTARALRRQDEEEIPSFYNEVEDVETGGVKT